MEQSSIAQTTGSTLSRKPHLRPLASAVRAKRGERLRKSVARELKIHLTSIRNVELGQRPNLKTFVKLMAWLEIPPEQWHNYMRSWK